MLGLSALTLCLVQYFLVNKPLLDVWIHPEVHPGPYQFPLCPGERALPLYSQLCYGELVVPQQNPVKKALISVTLPAQSHRHIKTHQIEDLSGYVVMDGIIMNDALLALPWLVVVSEQTAVRIAPHEDAAVVLHLPFGSIVRAELGQTHSFWCTVRLCDDRTGYVPKAEVAEYTAQGICLAEVRQLLNLYARKFVGGMYLLGGRSMQQSDEQVLSGVDCSGLVHLVYHACGFLIPRSAHAMYASATPIAPAALAPGDLIFFKRATKKFLEVGHVAMYLGAGNLIEATGLLDSCKAVQIVAITDYFGLPLEKLTQGMEVLHHRKRAHAKLFFGTFLPSQDAAVDLRNKFLTLMRGERKTFLL